MEKQSAFDILINNLNDLGFKAESYKSFKTFLTLDNDKFQHTEFVWCDLTGLIYFFAFDSFGAKVIVLPHSQDYIAQLNYLRKLSIKFIKKIGLILFIGKRKRQV